MQIDQTEKIFEPDLSKQKSQQLFNSKWLYNLVIKPRSTLAAILEKDRPARLIPLLVLTLLAAPAFTLLVGLISGLSLAMHAAALSPIGALKEE
ncbi:MAG TPA: hypothetical protein DD636_04810 [Anaerolineaceae bacterium]|nr:hypothetical protein [Anaerolineaceae bacterium]